jgi:hypothetical protein
MKALKNDSFRGFSGDFHPAIFRQKMVDTPDGV